MAESPTHSDSPTRVIELAVNLDDVTGEQVGAAIDRLLAAGALDAWATPITMKKNRPAVCLSVLAREDQRDELAKQLLADTGSFGVRYRPWERMVLDRSFHERQTPLGKLRVKVGSREGQPVTAKPEFEDVLTLACAGETSLAEAQHAARAAASDLLDELRQAQGGQADG